MIARASKAAGIVARNSLRFQGQQVDEESGLAYNRYRYYDSIPADLLVTTPSGWQAGSICTPTSLRLYSGLTSGLGKDNV